MGCSFCSIQNKGDISVLILQYVEESVVVRTSFMRIWWKQMGWATSEIIRPNIPAILLYNRYVT